MDKTVSFRFFKISRHNANDPKFIDVLRGIEKIMKKADREREIAPDFVVRLEELEADGANAVIGELIRVQSTNLPSEVHANGRSALTTKNPLGHGVTFRFNDQNSVLCIQHEPRIVSAGKVVDYLQEAWDGAQFKIKPMLRPKAWEKFNGADVKRFSVKIAQPENMDAVGAAHAAASDGIKAMADAYDSPVIRLELSMGHNKGFLGKKIKGLAKAIVDAAAKPNGPGLQSMKAVTYIDDTRDEFDLIEDRMKVRDRLELDDRDPDKNYKIKKLYIKKIMKDQGVY
jgi:hypothetical protein